MSVVFDFNASANDTLPVYPMLLPVYLMRTKKCGLLMDAICVLFLLCSPLRLSFVSVVFDFNASLNDVAPVSPMLLSIYLMRMENSVLLVDGICVLFLLSSQLRSSFVSVVFDFNASLIDVIPLSPMLLSIYLMKMEKMRLLTDSSNVYSFVLTSQIEFNECCV